MWAGAAALLTVPAIAMRFTAEVQWTASDFVVMGVMLAAACGAFEGLLRAGNGAAYRIAAALTVFGVFFLIWVNLAVGIIGSEDNDANMMFAAVIATVIGGACIAHFQPRGMARTLLAAAVLQVLIAAVAVIGRFGSVESVNWPKDIIGCTGILTAFWLISAALFARASRS
ncbi:hypothetical protein DVW87_00665 [Sphingomonas aracearum]|uniref:Uncharacterized protein n=1 Tax=Sphingomonas aracearum TaxID=2283317 RepID=A0A369VYT1_9SPHN|nr:hypothetical protein DVW87_00665 [Sphingomonas aracearum]